ncbi:MAG TPA: sigma-70 family RNA polymerase sigma factor [Stellaceae bacterium]|jgi:RNA polymerase sigma-70 factor (ECF subfamily)|nr:sigma-70 family RNA polymerase sigma factor [Stellaceae bacterium]
MTEIHQRIEAEIPRLRRYAQALVRDAVGADDLVQECLARALDKLDLWREGTDLRAWLFTILHNQYVNHVRHSIRKGTMVEFDEAASPLSQPANQEKRLELRDLDRALGQLAAEQRAVILLIGLEGMSYSDAGSALGIPVGTVRSRLSRGRLALRQLMDVEPDRHTAEVLVLRPEAPSRSAAIA